MHIENKIGNRICTCMCNWPENISYSKFRISDWYLNAVHKFNIYLGTFLYYTNYDEFFMSFNFVN